MKQKTAKIVMATLLLAPLPSIGQQTVPGQTRPEPTPLERTLARRAAFALHTTADKVEISDHGRDEDSPYRINFTATRDGKKFQCYVVASPASVSDALCAGTDGNTEGVRCNPLLKAAGQC